MADMQKFGAQMEAEVLARLREHAARSGVTMSAVLTDAVREYLDRLELRPAFVEAAEEVMDEHDELLARLAR